MKRKADSLITTKTNGQPFKMLPDNFITHALVSSSVEQFWHGRIMECLRSVMAGNKHFVSDVQNIRIRAGRLQQCESLSMHVTVTFPDARQDRPGIIQYKMTKAGHKSTLKLVE